MKKLNVLLGFLLINLALFSQGPETPTVQGDWWAISEKNRGAETYDGQHFDWVMGDACDFTVFRSADRKWHLISCIRTAQDPSNGEEVPRYFGHWETDDLRNKIWEKQDIWKLYNGWERKSMQAPHGFEYNGDYYVALNSIGANMLKSEDGRNFSQLRDYEGDLSFFEMGRDVFFFNDLDNSGKWISLYTSNPCGVNTDAHVGSRTADTLIGPWTGGCPNNTLDGVNPESPFLVLRGANDYYLWTQGTVRHSNDPLEFHGTSSNVMFSGKYAPEIIENNGEHFVTGYANGIFMAEYNWISANGLDYNVYLDTLEVGAQSLIPAFDKYVDEYAMVIPNDVSSLNINAIPESSNATVAIEGNSHFKIGKNTVKVTVTAENGIDKRVYSVYVYRLSLNEPLYELTVLGGSSSGMYPAGMQIPVRGLEPASSQYFSEWTGDVENIMYMDKFLHCRTMWVEIPNRDVSLAANYSNYINVEVNLTDRSTGDPLNGIIYFNGYRIFMGADGYHKFTDIREGMRNFWITESSDEFSENIYFTKDTVINIEFPPLPEVAANDYTINYVATYKGAAMENVSIRCNGTTLTTDAAGSVAFTTVPEGYLTYKVSKNPEIKQYWGSVNLQSDTTIYIEILKPEDYALEVNKGTGSGIYNIGNIIPVVANPPAPGYYFEKWVGDIYYLADRYSPETVFTHPGEDMDITAQYQPLPRYNLTVTNGVGDDKLYEGESTIISADAAPTDSVFNVWVGDIELLDNPNNATATLVMKGYPATLTATYRKASDVTYTLIVENGTGSGDYVEGAVIPIKGDQLPQGMDFTQWTGDISYVDDALQVNTTLTMPASAITITAEYADFKPDAPANLSPTSDNGVIDLQWDAVENVDWDYYNVYRSATSGSGYAQIQSNVLEISFTDNTVSNYTNYYYVVTAVDTAGNESDYSDEALAQGYASVAFVSADLTTLAGWRSTSVTKADDVDGNNVYGTDGYKLFRPDIETLPVYVNSITNGSNASTAGYAPKAFDDPRLSVAADVADIVSGDQGKFDLDIGAGQEGEFVSILLSKNCHFRLGVISGHNNNEVIDSIHLVGPNATTVKVKCANTQQQYTLFDVKGMAGDIIRVYGTTHEASQNREAIFGLFFDSPVSAGYDVNFVLKNEADVAVSGASITITGVGTQSTDVNGETTFTNVNPGDYSYSISAATYDAIDGDITIFNTPQTIGQVLAPTSYTITFVVEDEYFNALDGAIVSVDGIGNKLTNEDGTISFAKLLPATYNYTISRMGYNNDAGSINLVDADVQASVELVEASQVNPTYLLAVNDGSGDGYYEEGEMVNITANVPATGKTFDAWTGDVSYVTNVNSASTTVSMPATDIEVSATYKDLMYTITFHVTDGTDIIEDAAVTYNSTTINTNASGDAVFSNVLYGSNLAYSIVKTGYVTKSGTKDATADATENVTMSLISLDTYQVTIVVNEGTDPLQGASVSFNSQNVLTNTSGQAIFTGISNGTDLAYTVSKTGYDSENGTVDVAGSDIIETVSLSKTLYTLTVSGGNGSGQYAAGDEITVIATPDLGKAFANWTGDISLLDDLYNDTTTLTMPAANAGVTANFTDIPIPSFTLTVNNGTGSGDYEVGTRVTITADVAPTGEVFDKWEGDTLVLVANGTSTAVLYMPDSAITLTATYKVDESNSVISQKASINMYPNPAESNVWLVSDVYIHHINVMNVTGVVMKEFIVNSNTVEIDIQNLSSGIYFLNVQFADDSGKILRLIKD